jgi:hypothetical protein
VLGDGLVYDHAVIGVHEDGLRRLRGGVDPEHERHRSI